MNKYKNSDLFNKVEKLIESIEVFLRRLTTVTTTIERSLLLICSLGLFAKIFRTLKAIKILSDNELSEEAHCLVRVLVEATVTLKNLHKEDTEERSNKLLAFHHICLEKIVNARSSNASLSDVDSELNQLIQSKTDELKEEYGFDSYEEMRSKMWKGIFKGNIEKAFKEVGLSDWYDSLYRTASLNIHADDFLNYIETQSDGTHILLETNAIGTDKYLATAALFTLMALRDIDLVFKLSTEEEINSRNQCFLELEQLVIAPSDL